MACLPIPPRDWLRLWFFALLSSLTSVKIRRSSIIYEPSHLIFTGGLYVLPPYSALERCIQQSRPTAARRGRGGARGHRRLRAGAPPGSAAVACALPLPPPPPPVRGLQRSRRRSRRGRPASPPSSSPTAAVQPHRTAAQCPPCTAAPPAAATAAAVRAGTPPRCRRSRHHPAVTRGWAVAPPRPCSARRRRLRRPQRTTPSRQPRASTARCRYRGSCHRRRRCRRRPRGPPRPAHRPVPRCRHPWNDARGGPLIDPPPRGGVLKRRGVLDRYHRGWRGGCSGGSDAHGI